MSTANELLRDFEIARQIELLRLSKSETEELLTVLAEADAAIEERLIRSVASATTAANLRRLREQISSIILVSHRTLRDRFDDLVEMVAGDEAAAQIEAIGRALPTGVAEGFGVSGLTTERLIAAIQSSPMDGAPLRDWFRQYQRNDLERTWRAIRRGMIIGQSTDEIVRSVLGSRALRFKDGAREVTRRGLRTLVRTVTNHAAAEARSALFAANDRLIEAVQWVSTLDLRTSVICASLDGKLFPTRSGPRPPMHPNCRSTVVPVLRGWRALGLTGLAAGARASMDGQVAADVTFEDWLRRRSDDDQDAVLGQTGGRLFRAGMGIESFLGPGLQPLTIDELRRRRPDLFRRLGL